MTGLTPTFERSLRWAVLATLGVAAVGCRHVPSQKEQESAEIHYNLGIQHQQQGDIQAAYKEFDVATRLDPYFPEPWNARALLLHISFKRPDEAVESYQKALELRPTFSEAKVNLANVYLDQAKYDEAIKLYEEVLNDIGYREPYLASGNLGWAHYKKGDPEKGISHLRASVIQNPKFCFGYLKLGQIYDGQGKAAEACEQFDKYRESCPDRADAYYQLGVCQAKMGNLDAARESLAGCQTRATDATLKQDCASLLDKLR